MKIESPAFTATEVNGFLDELLEAERGLLVNRLEDITRRLMDLGPRIKAEAGSEAAWTAQEVLAHIAVFSKFYGVIVYRVGSGKLSEFDPVAAAQMRDPADEQMAQRPPAEILEEALSAQRRTLDYLRSAPLGELRREAQTPIGRVFRAEDVARTVLIGHLESHLEQLEKLLR
jgi:hypothetical protein